MIISIFQYFAQFPLRAGVLSLFANGRSDMHQYDTLLASLSNATIHSRIPEIQHYVFGQDYESVKSRIDQISGTYLFIDYGDIDSSRDKNNSISDTVKMAATIACKISSKSDLVEQAIVSSDTLQLANQLRALMHRDQSSHPWLKELSDHQEVVPFVSKEFSSVGWSIIFTREAADMFDLKSLIKSF